MKILCVIQRFSPVVGGSEKLAEQYLDFLSERHEVTVYTTTANEISSFWDEKAEKVQDKSTKNYKIKRYPILVPNQVPENLYSFPFTISSPGPFCPEM